MRYVLTSYQDVATADVLRWLRRGASDFAADGDYNAVSLSAPTGAGKTVIATAVIERLFSGDAEAARDPDATVLWVTDDPSLNEQTRRKMLQAASSLTTGQLVTVDAGFDQTEFDRNRVYFLNIQKLGRSTSYVTGGTDARRYSLWSTIGNTIRSLGGHFYVIIDEAHRGARATSDRQTIVSRIIADSTGATPPVPVVWGISATPDRFNAAMAAAAVPARSQHPVVVPPDEVKASGLIKDKVLIKHPTEKQPSDSTLTRLAVSDLTAMSDAWNDHSAAEGEPAVRPALVIQVRPSVSDADLAAILDTLADADGTLSGRALGHSFQDHSTLAIGSRTVRYIAPQDIHDDTELKVVLFKEALTTGWDCPRAEVMLSLRPARDTTYIAQLIGRMVRTPLAKRIVTNEAANGLNGWSTGVARTRTA